MNPKILCVIGARGSSVRLKRKNLQKYGNTTLLEWAIENALKSKYIDCVVVDSENNEILEVAKKQLVDTHQREPLLSEDDVSLYVPLKHVFEDYPEYKIVVIMQVDCPVENHEIIDRCIKTFLDYSDAEDVSTFYNNRRTGTVRVIWAKQFYTGYPTANIYSVEDRPDFVDIHTWEDLSRANRYLREKPHDTFQVSNKIREPIEYNTRMIYNHFKRYYEAIKILDINQGDVVIDASCGQGYGTFILSQSCKKAWGLDINEKHLEKARGYYPKLDFSTYAQWDRTWTKMKPVVDKIICIETLEHIPKNELQLFTKKLLRYLRKGGDLFVTVPVGQDKPSIYNPHHLNEPSFETLQQLFFPFFNQKIISINTYLNSFDKEAEYFIVSLYGKKEDE